MVHILLKIHNIGSGPGEYADISDFDIDADLNIYISSIVGRKIIKYKYPDYKLFTEYKTNATVMEIAVDEKRERYGEPIYFRLKTVFV